MILQKSKIKFKKEKPKRKKHKFLKSDVISLQLQNGAGKLKLVSGKIKKKYRKNIRKVCYKNGIKDIDFEGRLIFLVSTYISEDSKEKSATHADNILDFVALPCPPFCPTEPCIIMPV